MASRLMRDALNMAAWTRRGLSLEGVGLPLRRRQPASIAYTERLDEIGAAPSIGAGDSNDCDDLPVLLRSA